MPSFPTAMDEYKKQLERGYIQAAYQGIIEFFRDLKSHFMHKYPSYSISSSIYYGYMDMTYFSLIPETLKRRKLKIAIVFLHVESTFEVWLSGSNRDIQARFWEILRRSDLGKYHLASDPKTLDYVIRHILVEEPDFGDLEGLTDQIEGGTLEFIVEVESLLSGQAD